MLKNTRARLLVAGVFIISSLTVTDIASATPVVRLSTERTCLSFENCSDVRSTDQNTGGAVSGLQKVLKDLGYMPKDTPTRGVYGDGTYEAVRKAQEALGLPQTGQAGPNTLNALQAEYLKSLDKTSAEILTVPKTTGVNIQYTNTNTVAPSQEVPKNTTQRTEQQAQPSTLGVDKSVIGVDRVCDVAGNCARIQGADENTGGYIGDIQDFFKKNGYMDPDLQTHGNLGLATTDAIKAYQLEKGISPTGYIDAQTRRALAADDRSLVLNPTQITLTPSLAQDEATRGPTRMQEAADQASVEAKNEATRETTRMGEASARQAAVDRQASEANNETTRETTRMQEASARQNAADIAARAAGVEADIQNQNNPNIIQRVVNWVRGEKTPAEIEAASEGNREINRMRDQAGTQREADKAAAETARQTALRAQADADKALEANGAQPASVEADTAARAARAAAETARQTALRAQADADKNLEANGAQPASVDAEIAARAARADTEIQNQNSPGVIQRFVNWVTGAKTPTEREVEEERRRETLRMQDQADAQRKADEAQSRAANDAARLREADEQQSASDKAAEADRAAQAEVERQRSQRAEGDAARLREADEQQSASDKAAEADRAAEAAQQDSTDIPANSNPISTQPEDQDQSEAVAQGWANWYGASDDSSGCFIAGTKIRMADLSLKNIEDVKVGEYVLTPGGSSIVTDRIKHGHNGDIYAYNNTGHYFFTPNHPFLSTEGWKSFDPVQSMKDTEEIKVTMAKTGDVLIKRDSKEVIVSSQKKHVNIQVYNLTVAGSHEYYANDYLVHNMASAGSGGGWDWYDGEQ